MVRSRPLDRADFSGSICTNLYKDLTGDLTFRTAFWKIRYKNRTHDKILYVRRLKSTKSSNFYSSPELELSHFYYRGRKCFKIHLKVSYMEEDFFLLKDKTVLYIYLEYPFANQMNFTTFFHQQADSREIGGGFNYFIGRCEHFPDDHFSHRIEFELFRIVRDDQFELLKDPRRLFRKRVQVNDANTLEDQNRNNDQSTFESLDFEQNVSNTYTNVYYIPFKFRSPHFAFSFSFLVRRVVITNSENYTKLVVNLLNSLAIWLDICVLDLATSLGRFFALALRLYRLVIKISMLLCKRLGRQLARCISSLNLFRFVHCNR